MAANGTLERTDAPCPSCGSERTPALLPDAPLSIAHGGMVAIMFTDIEGSSALAEMLGAAWPQILQTHNALIRGLVLSHGGVEVSAMGDGFMIFFRDAASALACALAVQDAIARYNATRLGEEIRVRIGLHTGEVTRIGPDYVGRSIIVAARVTGHARGGEIMVSDPFMRDAAPAAVTTGGPCREVELRGLTGTHRLHRVARG